MANEYQDKDRNKDEDVEFLSETDSANFIKGDDEDETAAVEKIKKLKKKLKDCETDKLEYLTGWQRVKADYVNLKKRSSEAVEKSAQQARRDLLLDFFPVLDSFEMAMSGEVWERADPKWQHGLTSIYKQFLATLKAHGVESFSPLGEEFDPHIHTSVASKDSDDQSHENKIAEVLQSGYRYKTGEIIRSPKVIVYNYTN